MKKAHNTLSHLIEVLFINLDDFYVISIRKNGSIDLQGHFSSNLIKTLTANLQTFIGFEKSISEQGYVKIRFSFLETDIEIVLTD